MRWKGNEPKNGQREKRKIEENFSLVSLKSQMQFSLN
jgi:hypothetical protein